MVYLVDTKYLEGKSNPTLINHIGKPQIKKLIKKIKSSIYLINRYMSNLY